MIPTLLTHAARPLSTADVTLNCFTKRDRNVMKPSVAELYAFVVVRYGHLSAGPSHFGGLA